MVVTKGYTTITASPNTSGSIAISGGSDLLRWRKTGTSVHVKGRFVVASVTSPLGTYIDVPLPYAVADLTDTAESGGGGVQYFDGVTPQNVLPYIVTASASVFRIYIDASTVAASDQFRFFFTYETT